MQFALKTGKRGKNDIRGQSLVELVVGLLAVVLVLMGLLQIGRLGMEHTQTLLDGREKADELTITEDFDPIDPTAQYVWRVSDGADDRSYSQDDVRVPGEPQEIIDNVVEHAEPANLEIWMPTNSLAALERPDDFMQAFDLTYGQSHSERVELYPIIRNLVVEDEYIRLQRRVWMPWIRGIR